MAGCQRFYRAMLAILLLCVTLQGCTKVETLKEYRKDIFALNTWVNIRLYAGKDGPTILDKAVKRIEEIENRMSVTIPDSDVSRINSNAGKQPVKVHDDTFEVIKKALEYAELSNGAFDITIYPIVKLWGITSEHPRVPTEAEIKDKLKFVNYKDVVLNEDQKTVYLEKEGMGIDLGAIAKGYAADEVARILREQGVTHALINMGGNVVALGGKPDGRPWRVGVRNPRSENMQSHITIIEIMDGSVVSSGDYERYFEQGGKRYHHIFDPSTGYPANSGLMATTVVAPKSIDADALSTTVFIMGAEKGLQLVDKLEGIEALAVTFDKKIYASEGLKGKLTVTDKEYELQP
ncbi:thiamine biosynthesis lipoprotein [Caldicoprobacter guelmensis]|uniref:FAD:protein FMN transferase n=1 Tax=Caldicoprobacter guelmensis TaxID=1170224 RepID=UPI001956AA8A|nr:FAD:protein FMN transferase [Caldicoprobacter guelmensis]MBM7582529.1 thiamine biosynthesis lipoprotein [Caldicoprobacter guelmensis]